MTGATDMFDALPASIRRSLLSVVNRSDWIRSRLSRLVINRYATAAPARPLPHSMAAPYTTWPGLVDRSFSARHLPESTDAAHPDIEQTVALFRRKAFVPAASTNLLFAYWAQWFSDGFIRTKWNDHRRNESPHELDLCQIYGATEVQTSMLRDGPRLRSQIIRGEEWPAFLFRDGELAYPGIYTEENFARVYDSWPEAEKARAFAVGLEHGNSTLGHAMMNCLWLREHNRTARILAEAHPLWSDERVFQTARNVTIGCLLNIVVSDYIVHIGSMPFKLMAEPGWAEREDWYRSGRIPVEFALLYRWHDLIPETVRIAGDALPAERLRVANGLALDYGLDAVLRAAASDRAGKITLGNTAPFLGPVKRLSIELGRSCKLAPFNAYREHFGLAPYPTFEALTRDAETAAALRALYGHVDRVEYFVGLFAEGYEAPAMAGDLMVTMVAYDAFTHIFTNPLLAASIHNPATFGPEGYRIVRETTTLGQVIQRNTGISEHLSFGMRA